MSERIRVLAKPAFKAQKSSTSSCVCLYNVIKQKNVEVIEWSPARMMRGKYDVLHIHWPDNILSDKRAAVVLAKMGSLFGALLWVRILRKGIVWTAHNLDSHEQAHPRLEKVFWGLFPRFLDAILTPMYFIKDEVRKRPNFDRVKRVVVTTYGDWDGYYRKDTAKTQELADRFTADHSAVVLWFGFIRPYKGLETLIAEFDDPALADVRLVIAGSCKDPEYAEKIKSLAQGKSNISADIRFIPDEEVASYFDVADLCVFPFGAVTNSGSVRLALTFDRSVLVPDYPFAVEFQKEFGDRWVATYDAKSGLKAADIESALNRLEGCSKEDEISWGQYTWDTAAEKTIEVYKELS